MAIGMVPVVAVAQEAVGTAPVPGPAGGPPPAAISQRNLGQAGLLGSFYSYSQFGTTQSRGGEDATRLGDGAVTGRTSGYSHDAQSLVTALTGRKSIQNGTSYLTFGLGTNNKREKPAQTEFSTSIPSVTLGYQNFSDPNAAYAFAVTLSDRTSESQTGPVESGRTSIDLKFDYARKLSDNFGVTARVVHTIGDLVVETPGGTSEERQTVTYLQSELVGNFGSDDLGFIPARWTFHPTLGVSFNTDTVEAEGGDETTETGSVWAKAVMSRGAPPGNWAWNYTLGLEHVYKSDTAFTLIDEDTYGIFGIGAAYMQTNGNQFVASLEHRAGFDGDRSSTTAVLGYTFNF